MVAQSRQLIPYMQRAGYAIKNERDVGFEKHVAKEKLERDPEHVTSESSVRQFEPPTRPASGTESGGLKADLVCTSSSPGRRIIMVVGHANGELSRVESKKPLLSAACLLCPTNWAWLEPFRTSQRLWRLAIAAGT